jgi:hypothetical protein
MTNLPLEKLGIGPQATLFMYASERARVEELGRFALQCFRKSGVPITNSQALVTSLSREALAFVSGVDAERMRRCNVEVLWLQDGVELPEPTRFVERAIMGRVD